MARFTVIGAQGFIGGRLAVHLRRAGHEVSKPARGEDCPREPGHVVYCAGITADFRSRPFETVTAHVSYLAETLRGITPLSFLYLSSTRVYGRSVTSAEDAPVALDPADPDDLYNATKLAGEALSLAQPSDTVRVARLSNVYGPTMDMGTAPREDFLASVIRDSLDGEIVLRTAPESEKDYIAVEDVAHAVERIALFGRNRLYNVASGRNVTHRAIVERLSLITGCSVAVSRAARRIAFPPIDTGRIAAEFTNDAPWWPADLMIRLPDLIAAARTARVPRELAS